MSWKQWLVEAHEKGLLTENHVDRRLLADPQDQLHTVGLKDAAQAGHTFISRDKTLHAMADYATHLRVEIARTTGRLPARVTVNNRVVTDNRYFTIALTFEFADVPKGFATMLGPDELARTANLDRVGNMFLN